MFLMMAFWGGAYQGQNHVGMFNNTQTHNEAVTTLTGLLPGQEYQIDILHGVKDGPSSGVQHIDAGFASGVLTTILDVDGGSNAFQYTNASWYAQQKTIGNAFADGSGEIKIYVGATLNAERSIYNGLAYTVVPEPSSLLLMVLGLGALVTWRRRK